MNVWFIPLDGIDPDDPSYDEHLDHYAIEGTLTTEHAASSYGLPVIVTADGTAYGPGDTWGGDWSGEPGQPRNHALEDAARRAGWNHEPNYGQTDDTY